MENTGHFTKLTLEQNDLKITWEVPYEDVTGNDMMQAIRTIMIGMTFNPTVIEQSMADFLAEHSNGRYEIYENNENMDNES